MSRSCILTVAVGCCIIVLAACRAAIPPRVDYAECAAQALAGDLALSVTLACPDAEPAGVDITRAGGTLTLAFTAPAQLCGLTVTSSGEESVVRYGELQFTLAENSLPAQSPVAALLTLFGSPPDNLTAEENSAGVIVRGGISPYRFEAEFDKARMQLSAFSFPGLEISARID